MRRADGDRGECMALGGAHGERVWRDRVIAELALIVVAPAPSRAAASRDCAAV
jgi:hypothetical protein